LADSLNLNELLVEFKITAEKPIRYVKSSFAVLPVLNGRQKRKPEMHKSLQAKPRHNSASQMYMAKVTRNFKTTTMNCSYNWSDVISLAKKENRK
jgi:hypothetical protein